MTIDEALETFKKAGMSQNAIDKHRETIVRITNSPEDISCYTEFALKLYTGEIQNPLQSIKPGASSTESTTPRTYPWDSYGG